MSQDLNLLPWKTRRIEGERIYLRSLTTADVSEAYLRWMTDPEVNRFLESRFSSHDLAGLQRFVEEMAADPLNLLAGIFLRDTDRHIGNIKLGPVEVHHRRALIGLLVGERDCWGRGLASEAIDAITRFAFEQVGLHRLIAGAYEANVGSIRAFEKCGWRREAVFSEHCWCEGRYQDGISLGIVNSARGAAAAVTAP